MVDCRIVTIKITRLQGKALIVFHSGYNLSFFETLDRGNRFTGHHINAPTFATEIWKCFYKSSPSLMRNGFNSFHATIIVL